MERNQARNDFHDNRRSYSNNQNNQNTFFTPILPNNPQRQQNHQPNNSQHNSQNENNQQQPQKNQKNDQNDKKILDCDVFVGELPYISTDKDLKKVLKVIKHPGQMHAATSKAAQLKCVSIGENRRCRNLIVGLNPENYKQGAGEAQLFKDAENNIKNKTKFNEVIQKLSNDIAVATAYYKPRLTFIEILRRPGGHKSDFEAFLSYICIKNDYIAMIIDPVTRKPTHDEKEENQTDHYVKSLKWYFNNFTAPKVIKIEDIEAAEGINVNEL